VGGLLEVAQAARVGKPMNKEQRRKKFVAECCGPYPRIVTGAATWFEVVDALEIHAEKCLGGGVALKKIADQIRKQCKR
jgi:hypothetical protein